MVGIIYKSGSHRILTHVVPFLAVTLSRAEDVIEEFRLPDGFNNRSLLFDSFARPLLPRLHELRQRFCIKFRGAEEMDVVRHNYVAPDGPTMAGASCVPFLDKDCGDICGRENGASLERTSCDEIDRIIDPNPVEAPEVSMHVTVVAGFGDPGHLNRHESQAGITDPGYN